MEIMAMGKALLASDIGGHREMVRDGLNGLFFESENVEDLAAKCRLLITDGTLRRNLGLRARTWVEENRNWNVLTEHYLSLYARLAANGGHKMSA
jgi:glycosyltransferase involved in cell wall biosynthesis